MQVTKKNFEVLFPKIEEAIAESDFISYDLEFSSFLEEKEFVTLTGEYVYKGMASATNRPQILQFGMCCFKIVRGDPIKLICTPMSFKTVPVNSKTFSFTSKSIEFLSSTGFDFNKWIKEAIPYYTVSEYEDAKIHEIERQNRIKNELKNNNNNNNSNSAPPKRKNSQKNETKKDNPGCNQNQNKKNVSNSDKISDSPASNNNNNNEQRDKRNLSTEELYESFITSSAKNIVRYYEDYFVPYISEHSDFFPPRKLEQIENCEAGNDTPSSIQIESQQNKKEKKNIKCIENLSSEQKQDIFLKSDFEAFVAVPFTESRFSSKLRAILREYSIPLAINMIQDNYATGFVNPENGFKYSGNMPTFALSFQTMFADRDQKRVMLELFKNQEDADLISQRRILSETPYYKSGFLRILNLFKKYQKPLVLFSGIGDLFLLFREYIIGYEKDMLGKNDKSKNNNNNNIKKGKNEEKIPQTGISSVTAALLSQSDKQETTQNDNRENTFSVPTNSCEFSELVHEYFPVIIDLKSIFDSYSGYLITAYQEPIQPNSIPPTDSETVASNNNNNNQKEEEKEEEENKSSDKDPGKSKIKNPQPKQYRVRVANGSLEALYKYLTTSKTRQNCSMTERKTDCNNAIGGPIDIRVVDSFGEEPKTIDESQSLLHAHDASYDAYMTGSSFVMVCLRAISYKTISDIEKNPELSSYKLRILPDQLYLFRSTEYYTLENTKSPKAEKTTNKSLLDILNKISRDTAENIYDLSTYKTNIDPSLSVVCFASKNGIEKLPDGYEGFFKTNAAPFTKELFTRNLSYSLKRLDNIVLIRIKPKMEDVGDGAASSSSPSSSQNKAQCPTSSSESSQSEAAAKYVKIDFPDTWNTEVDISKVLPGFPKTLMKSPECPFTIMTLQKYRTIEAKLFDVTDK